jgi:putative transposase
MIANEPDVARIARELLVAPDSRNHCTWRAHDLQRVLEAEGAREKFLELVAKYKEQHGIVIHSYCLMGSHPHVVCKATKGQKEFSKFWKVVNHRFAWWFNRRQERRGQVVMERMRSPRIQEGAHLLTVMRYGDLNPVRAGLVKSPKDWPWSSFRHYAYGEPNPLIDDAPEYLALGKTAVARRKAYQALFAERLVAALQERRPDLVSAPFVGDECWMLTSMKAAGVLPKSRAMRRLD